MSNEAEREAFESWCASVGYHTERDMFQREKYQSSLTWELWRVWQAGAAYQRSQAQPADALADALNGLLGCPFNVDAATVPRAGIEAAPEQVVLEVSVALLRWRKASEALAAYRAAQEKK